MSDMRPLRWPLLLSVVVATCSAAHADTRIFSVETDRPGVTVTAIESSGASLPQVGQSGPRTFFQIDAGSETVPCSNQLAFTASNGQKLEYIVDLCAHNWQVTLPLGAAAPASPSAATPPSTTPPPPTPTAPASLTIYTDDATVGIEEVSLDRQPTTIASRQGNAAVINLSAPQRSKCEHDLGLALSDGRRIARMVDVCSPNGSIVVALNDDAATPGPPPPPVSGQPSVPPPPPVATTPPPPPTSPGEIEVVEGLSWTSRGEPTRAILTYARPDSDQAELFASCNRGSRQVEVSLARSAPEVQPGASVQVTFTAGTYAKSFSATGSDINALTGRSQPELTILTDDAFWTALIKEQFLVVQTGSAPPYALSLKGSAAAGRPFIEACNLPGVGGLPVPPSGPAVPPGGTGLPPPPGVPPAPGPVGPTSGDYPCSSEGTLVAQRTDIESRLIVQNQSGRSIQLFWIDYDGRRRPFLSLGPGESGVQPTFFTHPWVVADSSGRCMAIYYARNTDRQIVVGP